MGNIQLDSEEAAFISEAGLDAEHLDVIAAVPVLQRRIRNICWAGSAVICILTTLTVVTVWRHGQLAEDHAAQAGVLDLVKATQQVEDARVLFETLEAAERAAKLVQIIAINSDINHQCAEDGLTLLHQIVLHRSPSLDNIDFLIRAGADLNIKAYGWTKDVRDKNKLGMTPVMSALFHGKNKPQLDAVVLHLITRHADKIDFSLETANGSTLLAMAMGRLKEQPDNAHLRVIVEACKLHAGRT